MIKMALCDDDAEQRASTVRLLQVYAAQRPELAVKLSVFSSGPEVLAAEEKGAQFDLYVLDVVMPEMSGIELGVRLREQGCTGAIVYLTVSPEYAVDSYEAQAFYYLLKPVEQERLYKVLDLVAASIAKHRAACVTVKTKDGLRLVPVDGIAYVELAGRSACYHLAGGEKIESVTMRTAFQTEMAPLLANWGFFACGASFVVNFYYVTSVEKRFLTLEGGDRVPLSRGQMSQIRQQWSDYWMNRPLEDASFFSKEKG